MKNSSTQPWLEKIAKYEKEFKKWEGRADKIIRRYKDDGRDANSSNSSKFNILWSNVQTIVPAVFARLPKPDVSRRFKDNDPVGRVAGMLLERALEFEIEHYPDYRAAMKNSVQDRFLGGRGVSWVRYEPHISEEGVEDDGVQITEDADESAESVETLEYECAPVDYVYWKDFGHSIARTWEEVNAVWRKVYMTRSALVERFGEEIGSKIPLDTKPQTNDKLATDNGKYEACIYEIWDKESGQAIWLSKSMPDVLDERDDPLELESFFPCPRPLYATLTTESLVPTPDFILYQDQANTLDILCDRIDGLIKALQVKGVYDASIPELARLFTEGESGSMIPVKNWQSFAEKQGLKGAINLVELQPIFQALIAAYQAMEQVKSQIYDITGLSDIVRGQSEASETATAQRIKGQYASLRLRSMQGDVSQFATELLQLKAQIICKFFQPETILSISAADQLNEADKQFVQPAIELLKNEPLSSFRIEVSADSLVQIDEDAEKQSRMEFLTAAGGFIKQAVEGAQAAPEITPLLMELMKFGVGGFKVGKSVEGVFDEVAEKIKQQAMQPKQPQPDPAMAKVQQQGQIEQMKMQASQQAEQQRAQTDLMIRRQELQMEAQFRQAEAQQAMQLEEMKAQQNAQIEQMKAQLKAQTDLILARLSESTKIQVAEIGAQATLSAEQESAADAAVANG
jgi:hypothetical protein